MIFLLFLNMLQRYEIKMKFLTLQDDIRKNKLCLWSERNSSERNFVDIQDMGNELIATTSDGHIYASSSGGFSWFKRR